MFRVFLTTLLVDLFGPDSVGLHLFSVCMAGKLDDEQVRLK